jgi:hypothetical protein
MMARPIFKTALLLSALFVASVQAAVLPEDRADVMYHSYEGGGLTVSGPSVLVRKKLNESLSASAVYYVDAISSASIDVVASGASRYAERHEEKSLSVDYLRGKTTYSAGYMRSDENDYTSDTMSLGLSQDMFGDLTTVSMGFSRGWDTVGDSTNTAIAEPVDRRSYRLGISQVMTRNALLSLNFETITEQGYLQNPYRSIRFLTSPTTFVTADEIYPETRTGNAGSARVKYYLPWRAALEGGYRFYTDSWGINAHTANLDYTHPWHKWTFSGTYRYYQQTGADFFSDLFPRANHQNFMARDKETSPFSSHTIGASASYEFPVTWLSFLKKGTANLQLNHLMITYDEFRDLTPPLGAVPPGSEPLYTLDANIYQFYLSFWF